jgi:hypothetical protein
LYVRIRRGWTVVELDPATAAGGLWKVLQGSDPDTFGDDWRTEGTA